VLDEYLTRLPIHDWNDMIKLIKEQISSIGGTTEGKGAFKNLQYTFKIISEKKTFLYSKSLRIISKSTTEDIKTRTLNGICWN
jgi:hypothetical protein